MLRLRPCGCLLVLQTCTYCKITRALGLRNSYCFWEEYSRILTDARSGFTQDTEENLFCCFSPWPCKTRWQVSVFQFHVLRVLKGAKTSIHSKSSGNKLIHVPKLNPQCDSLPVKTGFFLWDLRRVYFLLAPKIKLEPSNGGKEASEQDNGNCSGSLTEKLSYLLERVVEFTQDIVLVKDFALVAMFVVVVNFLSHVCWKLVEGHVLLHLFVLGRQRQGDNGSLRSCCIKM